MSNKRDKFPLKFSPLALLSLLTRSFLVCDVDMYILFIKICGILKYVRWEGGGTVVMMHAFEFKKKNTRTRVVNFNSIFLI